MSALAEILQRGGYNVSGSDDSESAITARLSAQGIKISIGNKKENITDDMDLVVYTAAIKPDNPEYIAAGIKQIPLMTRAALLGLIMEGYKYSVCVAGTHGKTTTTSLLADIAIAAGLDPTITLGGHMGDGYNYKIGGSPYFIMEACEYARQFLQWKPYVGVILNIDNDHMDVYGSMENLIGSFAQFARNIQPGGALVIRSDVPGFADITAGLSCRVVTFGGEGADFTAKDAANRYFNLLRNGAMAGRVGLGVPGGHNIQNALACIAVAFTLGVGFEAVVRGLSAAKGARRRYEHKGVFNGADIVDDYAHHPTEIDAFLSAVRKDREGKSGRIVCLFQPHTYTRTRNLLTEMSKSFSAADVVCVLPIFASRETYDPTISSMHLVEKINAQGVNAVHVSGFDEADAFLRSEIMPGDMLITMGAGDVFKAGETLLRT
jgi:UDP-N-acetylmuramate--alanine ligase